MTNKKQMMEMQVGTNFSDSKSHLLCGTDATKIWLASGMADCVSLCQSSAERFLCTLQSKVVKFMEGSGIVHGVIATIFLRSQ